MNETKQVKSKYLEYFTADFFKEMTDRHYDMKKFEEDYKNNPNRMTPAQIKMNGGYDTLHSSLRTKFLDTKYDSLYNSYVAMSTSICEQMMDAIINMFPDVDVSVREGKVNQYGDRRIVYSRVEVKCAKSKDDYIYLTPTLDIENHFNVEIWIGYKHKTRRYTDEEVMQVIEGFVEYINTGVAPVDNINKVYHKGDNQFGLYANGKCMEEYDIEFVMLYHTLARDMNKYFGTEYEYSEEVINALYKQKVFGNINHVGGFYLKCYKNAYGNRLNSYYFYLDDKTKKPDFRCEATYGEWIKEELIALLDTLLPCVKGDYFIEHSKSGFKKKYDEYDKIGVGYSEKPEYFESMRWK